MCALISMPAHIEVNAQSHTEYIYMAACVGVHACSPTPHTASPSTCSVLEVAIERGHRMGANQPLLVPSFLAAVPDELVDGKAGDGEAGHTRDDDHHSIYPVWVWHLLRLGEFRLRCGGVPGKQSGRPLLLLPPLLPLILPPFLPPLLT